ncbi:MAG: aminoacetone oxidase family FAD-binding enzyme [Methanobacteriaceae archaeon]|nr:aminoacetone oxidase family FAD-binding enzyme [Methanobacteriaceae archaeon]
MNNYKIAIIGGGPSGMLAAIKAAEDLEGGEEIVLIEKNDTLGKKLLLTGGGRCNIVNMTPLHEQIKYYDKNKNFTKHALYTLPPEKILAIFEDAGLNFHTEDNKRVFPDDEDAEVILDVLEEYLDDLDVNILLECEVDPNSIEHELDANLNPVFTFKANDENNNDITITCEKLIVATGGITYQMTGSTGDGYKIAKTMNHTVTQIKPGLVSFETDDFLLTTLSGMVLEGVDISFKDKKKKIKEHGAILITHNGLSGPGIMNLSNKLMAKSDYDLLREDGENTLYKDIITIDLSPDLTEEDIKDQITKDTPNQGTTKIKNYLKVFLPTNFIDYFLMTIGVSSNKTMASITKKDKNKIAQTLKGMPFKIDDLIIDTAKVTIGGVKSDEINSKTLESKYVEGLYFVGEVLEMAGPTGGYNLELAFSTGYLAAQEAVKSLKN